MKKFDENWLRYANSKMWGWQTDIHKPKVSGKSKKVYTIFKKKI